MTCREFIEFLMEYLSRELSEAERAEFEKHLAVCESCVHYLKTYQETIQLGRAAFSHPDEPVPAEVPEGLVRAILAVRGK